MNSEKRLDSLDLLCTLAQIPAPSNDEGRRAEFCLDWLHRQGGERAYIDEALNVILPFGDVDGDLRVIMAHSDVVFPDTEPLPLHIENGRVYCPGVGDDTANVVCLLTAAKRLSDGGRVPKEGGVLVVINSGEEGLGNLKGCREIMNTFGKRVREFITLDGSNRTVHNKPVGSRRYEITVRTEGGHSYGDFGRDNAVACLSDLICRLYRIEVPAVGKTTYNVGTICGGTSVNTIAQSAAMLYEFRSDEAEGLEMMQAHLDREIAASKGEISVRLVGERPCGGQVDVSQQQQLDRRAAEAIRKHFGHEPCFTSGSTDCNVPASMGIPSVSVGCIEAAGAHTREEYVVLDSVDKGCDVAAELLEYWFE